MTVKQLLGEGMQKLKDSTQAAWLETYMMLAHVLNKDRTYLIAHDDETVEPDYIDKFRECVEKRIKGTPVQYIIGQQEFMSLNFSVNPDVLIPRPETELLVEEVQNYIAERGFEKRILIADIGTGSGCISISIANSMKNVFITAVDVSKQALETASLNAQRLEVIDRIEFVESDLFTKINDKKFDIIVSNPPYIPSETIKTLQVEVKDYEPVLALDGGVDGLDYYKKIVNYAPGFLNKGGLLAFEIGCEQAEAVKEIFDKAGKYNNIRVKKDFAGKDRIVLGTMK